MRRIKDCVYRVRAFFTWGRMEREMDDEMAFHMEMEARKHMARGMTEEDARRRARRDFGEPMRQKEHARDAWGIGLAQDLRADTRYALRRLWRAPVFTVVAVATLALGIGGATAVFSLVNGVLLKPLSFDDPNALVAVYHAMPAIDVPEAPLSLALYVTFREWSRTLEDIGIWRREPVSVTGLGAPEQVEAVQVTDGLLPLLGLTPLLGRGFTREDTGPASTSTVILSSGYWLQRFGGDRGVLGRTLRVDGQEAEIIGVMPAGVRIGDLEPRLFLPLAVDPASTQVGNFSFPSIARLRADVTLDQVGRELSGLLARGVEQYGGFSLAALQERDFSTFARPLKDDLVGPARSVLWVVFGTVGLVLLIACINVANLFLVRAESHQRDVALRTALGASRSRLARQSVTESLLVGLLGAAVGLVLAVVCLETLLQLAPPSLPRLHEIGLDPTVLSFALAVSLLAGILFGLFPVLRRGGISLSEPLKDGGRDGSTTRSRFRLRNVFVVVQVALALVLMVGSGLMIRTFQALRDVHPGFERPEEVLTLRLGVPPAEATTDDEAALVHREIVQALSQIPAVTSVGAAAGVAMEDWESWGGVRVEGFPETGGATPEMRRFNWVVPGYFNALENPLLAGRDITWDDIQERAPVAVVTENFATQFWDEPARAIGGRIRPNASGPWREIVGVVGDVHTRGVARDAPSVIYWPLVQAQFWGADVLTMRSLRYTVRTSRPDVAGLLPEVRDAVWSVNPGLPLAEVMTLDQILSESISRTSFTLFALGIAAAIALILGVVGVYGVVSYVVSLRTREMGVRKALGARNADVSLMVLRQGGSLALVGVLLGLVAAAGLTRLLSTLLFGVDPFDPLTYGAVSTILVVVVLLATYIPARRASRVAPSIALRWD